MKYIFENMVMKGMQDHTGQWWKVVEDCVRCGKCCKETNPNWCFAKDEEGGCIYLEKEDDGKTFRCDLRGYRPFGCCCNDPHTVPEYCSVVLEKIDDPTTLL